MYDGIKYALCYIWNEKKDQKADGHWPQMQKADEHFDVIYIWS